MMGFEKLTSKQKLVIFALTATVIFALPQVLRTTFYHDSMYGSTTYYHTRISDLVVSGAQRDLLSLGGRPLTYPPAFPWMVYLVPAAKFILPALIGGLGIFTCYFFVKGRGLSDKKALYSSIFLFFNPAYAYFSIHLNPRLPALIVMLLSFIMIDRDNKILNALSFVTVAFALFLSPLVGISMIVIGAVIFRNRVKRLVIPFSSAFGVFFLTYLFHLIDKYGLFHRHEAYNMFVEFSSGIRYFIIESGVTAISFNVAVVIMAIYGFFKLKGKPIKPIREWLLIGFLGSLLIFSRLNDVLIFPMSIIAGTVFVSKFQDLKSSLKLDFFPRNSLKILVVLYLILVIVTPGIKMVTSPPTPNQYEAMTWIKNNTPENATIMAYWWEGHYITSIANRKNVMDVYLEYAPNVDERYNDIQQAMTTCRANETIGIMEKYNASYLLYKTSERDTCSGFFYTSKHGRFKEVYSNKDYKIYRLMDEPVSPGSSLCKEFVDKK